MIEESASTAVAWAEIGFGFVGGGVASAFVAHWLQRRKQESEDVEAVREALQKIEELERRLANEQDRSRRRLLLIGIRNEKRLVNKRGLSEHVPEALVAPAFAIDEGLDRSELIRRLNEARSSEHAPLGEMVSRFKALTTLRRFDEARSCAERAVQRFHNSDRALNMRGIAREICRDCEGALADFDAAIAIDGANAKWHFNRSNVLMALGRRVEGLEALNRACELDSSLAIAHNNRGTALAAMGSDIQAAKAYEVAVTLRPESKLYRSNFAVALARVGRNAEAEVQAREAIRIEPAYAPAHYNLSVALGGMGRHAEAYEACVAAHTFDAKICEAAVDAAHYLVALERYSEAVRWAEVAVAQAPHEFAAHANLGHALWRLGDFVAAEAHLDEAIHIADISAEVRYVRGCVKMQLGKSRAAQDDFERCLAFEPEHVAAKAAKEEAARDVADALNALREVEVDRSVWVRMSDERVLQLARYLQATGRSEFAVALLSELATRSTESAEPLVQCGRSHELLGRAEDAYRSYLAAAQREPDCVEAQRGLARVLAQKSKAKSVPSMAEGWAVKAQAR